MRELPPGWATTIAVLELTGSVVEDHGDHLVLVTPHNPDFHWGNCVFVTDDAAVGDAQRWVDRFQSVHPAATWIAIGLIQVPGDTRAWESLGISVELDDVLATSTQPRQTPGPHGYVVRQFEDDDWDRTVARALAEHGPADPSEQQRHEQFVRQQAAARRALVDRGHGAFFGAFAGDLLVSELGIVACGTTARYQNVGTNADHRRRGLASHLLGLAGQWAADHGCDRWVIVTEATNPAGRVYRAAGFTPAVGNAEAYREPSS